MLDVSADGCNNFFWRRWWGKSIPVQGIHERTEFYLWVSETTGLCVCWLDGDGIFRVVRSLCGWVSDRFCAQRSSPHFCIYRCSEMGGKLTHFFPWWTVFCWEYQWGGFGSTLVNLVYVGRLRMCRPHIYTSRQACVWLFFLLSSPSLPCRSWR